MAHATDPYLRVTTDVRSAPGSNARLSSALMGANEYSITGEEKADNGQGYCQPETDGGAGWVLGCYQLIFPISIGIHLSLTSADLVLMTTF